jgi:alginate O-acetyltransferase complex protein AlgI
LVFANQTERIRNKIVDVIGIKKLPTLYKIIQIIIIFCLTSFAWIFFRAMKVQDAFYIIQSMFTGLGEQLQQLENKAFIEKNVFLGQGATNFAMVIFALIVMEIVHLNQRGRSLREVLNHKPILVRWVLYYGIVLAILFLGMYDKPAQFIYFQF